MSFSNRIIYVVAASPNWEKIMGDRIFMTKENAEEHREGLRRRGYTNLNIYEVWIDVARYKTMGVKADTEPREVV